TRGKHLQADVGHSLSLLLPRWATIGIFPATPVRAPEASGRAQNSDVKSQTPTGLAATTRGEGWNWNLGRVTETRPHGEEECGSGSLLAILFDSSRIARFGGLVDRRGDQTVHPDRPRADADERQDQR